MAIHTCDSVGHYNSRDLPKYILTDVLVFAEVRHVCPCQSSYPPACTFGDRTNITEDGVCVCVCIYVGGGGGRGGG